MITSGHVPGGTSDSRLNTGMISLKKYRDFPHIGGFIYFEGINVLFHDSFQGERNMKSSLYVVLADFPGQALIDTVNSSNR